MSQFYGSMQGSRGEATRTGGKNSGIEGHLRGWNIGVKIRCRHNITTGKDECDIYRTGGSNGAIADLFITTITEE